jgi:hypothetical protein
MNCYTPSIGTNKRLPPGTETYLNGSPLQEDRIIFSTLRGTHAFWDKQKAKINHMIAALGPPTARVTFSSADTFTPDIEGYLRMYVSGVVFCHYVN